MSQRKKMDTQHVGGYWFYEKDLIGKGTFGKIYRAQREGSKGSENMVAIKEINLKPCSTKDKEHVQREAEVLQTCRHENLVQFVESFSKDNYLYIVMELCNGGNLRKRINENEGLKERECINILEQICNGLKYLHDKNIAHRDVKTTNILLQKQNGELVVKIGDFGVAKVMDMSRPTVGVGSPYFMSPEMISGKPYDQSTDIWSLGCCAYEMATTDVPYEAKKIDSLKRRINEKQVESSKIPYCRHMQDLISAMMEKEKTRRPSAQQILTFLHQHNPTTHTTEPPETEGRRVPNQFASTWPGRASTSQSKPTHDTSGYDTNDEQSNEECSIVHVPVKMTEEEKDYLAKADQLQKDICKKLGGDTDLLSKINVVIGRTKHMDNDTKFMFPVYNAVTDCNLS
ncbi:serine/threonine-protein kinase Nek5-like isoform X2 [Mercenaria mercenaria]|uniref:serine/threonine-protein kinase Nek5-like isoform X2 n=1 Tax=Mercenaria mercenaria TaxID=6596 RepID=UPI00234E7ADA|nr:serine/threonine-protein kinase Nek5-like isoform X2 [Mercenaria mercenaria]